MAKDDTKKNSKIETKSANDTEQKKSAPTHDRNLGEGGADEGGDTNNPQFDITALIPLLNLLKFVRQPLAVVPTAPPKNFLESIQYFDDGTTQKIYFYVSGAWSSVTLGGGGANARSYGTGVTSIATATDTKLTLASNSFANGVTWDAANSRLVIVTPGQYLVNGFVSYDSSAGAANKVYQVMLYKNGSEITRVNSQSSIASTAMAVATTDVVDCIAGDYFELWTAQYSGVNRSIPNNTETCYLAVAKV